MIPPNAAPPASWFMDLRKAALLACIASVLSLPIPVWNLMQSTLSLESAHPGAAISTFLQDPRTILRCAVVSPVDVQPESEPI